MRWQMGKHNKFVIDQELLDKVENLAARGLTQEQIALCLDIHPDTLSHKKAEHEQLEQAIKRGQSKGVAAVTKALLKNVVKGNVTAQIFYLKCKGGFKEQQLTETDKRSLVEMLIDKL